MSTFIFIFIIILGFALDQFSSGILGLVPTTKRGQKIGKKFKIKGSEVENVLWLSHFCINFTSIHLKFILNLVFILFRFIFCKIGLLLDKSIESGLLTRHLQVADAARATLGKIKIICLIYQIYAQYITHI